jgi:thioredoxin-related protein
MIKKLLLTVFLFTTIISANDKLKWYGFDEGLAKAKKENKFLLVDFYTDWCGWCKKMDSETYANKNIIKLLNKDFVLVKLNPEILIATDNLPEQLGLQDILQLDFLNLPVSLLELFRDI